MRESQLEKELEQAEEVYDGLIQTRRSLGTMLAETIRRAKDLEEFKRHRRDLPHLIQQADLRMTELRHELLDRRARRAEDDYRRAAEEASKASRALEQARRAYIKAEDMAKRLGLEARRLAERRDDEAAHLQELLRVGEDAQPQQGDRQRERQGGKREEMPGGGQGAQGQRQQQRGEKRIHELSQTQDGDVRATPGAGIAGQDADRRSADVTTNDVISVIAVGACVVALAACVLAYLVATLAGP
jgi:hypothetical protein